MAISREMTRRRRRILRSAAIAALGLAGPSGVAQAESFTYTGATVNYTVAAAGTYEIAAYGGAGGEVGFTDPGGVGAQFGGFFTLAAGDQLAIAVGGRGANGTYAGGGGGGSFVYDNTTSTLLIVAGGGGGAGGYSAGNAVVYQYPGSGSGGTGGYGGGGGGFLSGGQAGTLGSGGGGFPSLAGGLGGLNGGSGGFGGGGGGGGTGGGAGGYGGGIPNGGGGGGGFTGGAGGGQYSGSGGGTSFLNSIGTYTSVPKVRYDIFGVQYNIISEVDITFIPASVPEPGSLVLMATGFAAMAAGSAWARRRRI